MTINIGIVDDHLLFLESLVTVLESSGKFKVLLKALNGWDMVMKMEHSECPDLMLVDVNMPKMNGIETTKWLKNKYPGIKIVALSMNDDERTIIQMIKAGCCSYLLKGIHPDELENALELIYTKGYYNGDAGGINFVKLLNFDKEAELQTVTEKEMIFLNFACSDLTYKEIGVKMSLTERNIEKIRDGLFEKFKVQSRVGLCMEALRQGLVKL